MFLGGPRAIGRSGIRCVCVARNENPLWNAGFWIHTEKHILILFSDANYKVYQEAEEKCPPFCNFSR
jgi:hypothetical protein